jgi:hypothetical protein
MGVVHHLQQFHLDFDAEAFIAGHADCPNEPMLLNELWQLVTPSVFWREERISENDGDILMLGKDALRVESCYVCKGLQPCSRATIMALTIGTGLPDEARRAAEQGQLYRSAIADYLGSHAVEQLAEAFCQYLQQQTLSRGLYATLRYSPGYGDWALTAQPDVFAFLNQCKGEIQLSENFLMEPVKSITAIIGWSDQWQQPQYPSGEHNSFCNGGHNCAACVTWACRKGRSR